MTTKTFIEHGADVNTMIYPSLNHLEVVLLKMVKSKLGRNDGPFKIVVDVPVLVLFDFLGAKSPELAEVREILIARGACSEGKTGKIEFHGKEQSYPITAEPRQQNLSK